MQYRKIPRPQQKCAVKNCENLGVLGAHVWLEGNDPERAGHCYIMNSCSLHNAKTYDIKSDPTTQISMRLRKAARLVPAQVIAEMRIYGKE